MIEYPTTVYTDDIYALHLLSFTPEYAGIASAGEGNIDEEESELIRQHLCNLSKMGKCSTLSRDMRRALRYHAHVLRQMLPHKTEV